MDGPGLQFVRQGRLGRMLSLPAQQAGEAARARAVQRGRPDDITAAVLRLENS